MALKYDLIAVKISVLKSIPAFSFRGLFHTTKWLSEIVYSLKQIELPLSKVIISFDGVCKAEFDRYLVAFTYFKDQEYDRCVFYLKGTVSPACKFLIYYATYMSAEYKKLCETTQDNVYSMAPICENYLKSLLVLCNELKIAYIDNKLDGFTLYVYGLVLKRLNHIEDARDIFIEAIHQEPLNWAAWLELTPLIPDVQWVDAVVLPDHWMKDFFIGHLLVDLQQNKRAKEAYKIILDNGFDQSSYIHGQVALCQHNIKDGKSAISIYNDMRKSDPYRLEGMDTHSNLLYVNENKKGLAYLAHCLTEIDKYRVETSCVVGNYYSMRKDPTRAITSFERAVRMNPYYVNAWTLLGHEYLEVKNVTASIKCYLKAINVNQREYRAWHGLGQSYETLRLYFFALYYYRVAQKLVPQDCRMLIALGEVYERLERYNETFKCFKRAREIDKHEPSIPLKLAKLLEKLNEEDSAAEYYEIWVHYYDSDTSLSQRDEHTPAFAHACMFLVKLHISRGDYDKASEIAVVMQRHAKKLSDQESIRQVFPL